MLSNQTRRRICSILTDPDPPVSERDLAVELAIRDLGKPAAEITADERSQYLIQLHHHHLPKLADNGLITYDRSTRTVSITKTGYEAVDAHPESQPKLPLSL